MAADPKTNFMKISEFYLKMTAQQHNAFDNEQLLSLLFSEKDFANKCSVNVGKESKPFHNK